MSVSLWRYTEDCNGNPCPGDCDLCEKNLEDKPHWIYNEKTDMFGCSECGGVMVRNIYNFCPWCGVKMGGAQK